MLRNRPPDIRRPDSDVVLIGERRVGIAARQQAAADAALEAWERLPWPEGLLSHNCFGSEDGETVVHYSQWTDEDAVEKFKRADQGAKAANGGRARVILDAAPEVERLGVAAYRVYRSVAWNDGGSPGCIVMIRFEVDGLDQQLRLYQSLAAAGARSTRPEGLLAVHFHFSVDRKNVLNYTEWSDAEAHRESLDGALVADRRRVINGLSGVRPLGYKRYRLLGGLAVEPASAGG